MVRFSNDVDLLKWEPMLFVELARLSQKLCEGSDGELSGTGFSSASGFFVSQGVKVGHVICLSSSDAESRPEGCYEVVSVDSETALTISVVRESCEDDAIAPPGGGAVFYRISTFDPQLEEVSYNLLQYFGIEGTDAEGAGLYEVLNRRVLRQGSVFATLSAIFASCSYGSKDKEGFWKKSLYYQKMFQEARSKVRLEVDTNQDSNADRYSCGGSVRLRRL